MAPIRRNFSSADRFAIAIGLACLVAGIALVVVGEGFAASLAGASLLGIAAIAFVALVFLLIGESEDRDYGNRAG